MIKHLKDVKAGYLKHFLYATYFNIIALLIFITGTIHAFFPWWFVETPYKLAKLIVTEAEQVFNIGVSDE